MLQFSLSKVCFPRTSYLTSRHFELCVYALVLSCGFGSQCSIQIPIPSACNTSAFDGHHCVTGQLCLVMPGVNGIQKLINTKHLPLECRIKNNTAAKLKMLRLGSNGPDFQKLNFQV